MHWLYELFKKWNDKNEYKIYAYKWNICLENEMCIKVLNIKVLNKCMK